MQVVSTSCIEDNIVGLFSFVQEDISNNAKNDIMIMNLFLISDIWR